MIIQRTELYTTTGVVKSTIHGNIINISFNRNIQYQYRQISNKNKNRNLSPRVLNLKEKGTARVTKLNKNRKKGMRVVQKKDILNAKLNVQTPIVVEEIKNISFASQMVHKEHDNLPTLRSKQRMLLKAYFDQLRINNLKAVNNIFTLKKRVLNLKSNHLIVTYSPKGTKVNKANVLQQLLKYKQYFTKKWAFKLKARVTKTNFIKTQIALEKQKVRNIAQPCYISLNQKINKKLQKLQKQKLVLTSKAKLQRFKKQRYLFLKSQSKLDIDLLLIELKKKARQSKIKYKRRTKKKVKSVKVIEELKDFVALEEEMEAHYKTPVETIMSSIVTKYTENAKPLILKNLQQKLRVKEYLQYSQIRRLIDITNEKELYKNKELSKRNEKKLKKSIQQKFLKTVVIAVNHKKNQQKDSKKELIIKVLLNILRRKGEVPFEGKIDMVLPYLKELGRKQDDAKMNNLALNLQMRIVTDLLNYKGDTEVKNNHVALVRKRIDYLNYMSQNPRRSRNAGPRSDYKVIGKAKYQGKMMYAKLTEQRKMLENVALKNNYNILNNIIESEKKLYKLRLPKQRVTVPTLYQIYERVINHIKGFETKTQGVYSKAKKFQNILTKLQAIKRNKKGTIKKRRLKKAQEETTAPVTIPLTQGVLRITLKKKNMFLVLQNLSTKHIDTTVTARQEYYRIYNPKEIDPLEKKKKQALKLTALKPLGPIGRVIGTDLFRRRVITQVLLNLKAQIKYNVLDIEIRKPGFHSIINTILYKLWYIYEDQGLLRMYKFTKNKAHGSMRKKKHRRL